MKAASLNHVYRLVWSKLQEAWVPVAETTTAHGKSSVNGQVSEIKNPVASGILDASLTSSTKWRFVVASAFAAAIMPFSSMADNNVVAGVVAGDLTVKDISDTHTQYIHTANVNIVDFYKFGVMKGHQLDVVMPDAARALYRVIGNSQSEIMGTLNSNGSLFLINQNGILFGQGSEVNVGNIVASSLNISNEAFLQGNYQFTAGNLVGNIENRGVIKTQNEGYIVLLGNTVDNSGTLVASNGSVVLGSAQTATLDFFGNGLVKAKLSGDALEATIKNSGNIYADGGVVQMATNARAAAINISGIVEANQLVERDGMIRLEGGDNAKVQVTGQLIAKGENTTGGTIEVTGEQVALLDGAVLDASGDTGGGKVLVGGDYQGKNDAVYNSRTTYIAQGATIKADALQQGDGGKVIVWADDLTRYYGSISAQGGVAGGNGGFVEVSGKEYLDFYGKVNLTAANGLGGTLLLDPTNIILGNTSSMIPSDVAGPDVAFADNTGGATTRINVNDVQGFNELFLQAENDITVESAISMTKAFGSIRFVAKNDINVNANIKSGFFGYVDLQADSDNSGAGNINIKANTNITGGSGGVALSAVNITQTSGSINTNQLYGGAVKIDAKGDVNLGATNINTNGKALGPIAGVTGGDVEINAKSLTMTGSINTVGSASNLTSESGGRGGNVTITTKDGDMVVGNITTGAGDAGLTSTSDQVSGSVNLTSAKGSINTGNVNTNGGFNSFGGKVAMNAAGEIKTGDINTSAGTVRSNTDGKTAGDINIKAGGSLTVGTLTAKGADGRGANQFGGDAGAVTLLAETGDVTVGAVDNRGGAKTGNRTEGSAAVVFIRAGNDVIQKGNIVTSSKSHDAVTLVAGRGYKNTGNFGITTGTGGRWLIYSASPDFGTRGAAIFNGYNFKQYGVTYDGVKNGTEQINLAATGNGLIYSEKVEITPRLTGDATKVYDTTTVADISGLGLVTEGRDGDIITYTKIVSASYDDKNVGVDKLVTTNPLSIVSVSNTGRAVYGYTLKTEQATGNVGVITPANIFAVTGITANDKLFDGNVLATLNTGAATFNGRLGTDQLTVATANGQFLDSAVGNDKPVFISDITLGGADAGNYQLLSNTGETTASILPLPTTPTTGLASPRDDAGLGGLIPNNPVLNTMLIVSLNPAAGDEEDLDAVACPTPEDRLGATPILSSGVKLPDGVNSNCI
ncbi:YDG domain-containing protein [Methylophilus methylotrophus]|uniref:YDG domain-containing protein n=1 Tax=Methylophilus methylotrophus TaxID=17 RepID=UPI00036D8BCB|nr:YDG domain-containing protein [Methylophilus methylotrophus]